MQVSHLPGDCQTTAHPFKAQKPLMKSPATSFVLPSGEKRTTKWSTVEIAHITASGSTGNFLYSATYLCCVSWRYLWSSKRQFFYECVRRADAFREVWTPFRSEAYCCCNAAYDADFAEWDDVQRSKWWDNGWFGYSGLFLGSYWSLLLHSVARTPLAMVQLERGTRDAMIIHASGKVGDVELYRYNWLP